ncbi:MAG: hypothetical protein NXI31_21650 [bacterium]|nr:hypothetical protein [bacterium]
MDSTFVADSTLAVIGFGLAAGSLHVVLGPDHLAAVAPIAAKEPRRGLRVGLLWGLGHGLGAALLGGLALVVQDTFDVAALSEWSEFLVGFLLIGLGLWAFRAATRTVIHSHEHDHDGSRHRHVHVHTVGEAHSPKAEGPHRHGHLGLGMGFVHGAAGTGHLLTVMPALALPTGWAVLYLACYFVAAVASMGLFGLGLGRLASGSAWRLKGMMYASSVAGVGVGVFWVITTWPGSA